MPSLTTTIWPGLAIWATVVGAEYVLWTSLVRALRRQPDHVLAQARIDLSPIYANRPPGQLQLGRRYLLLFSVAGLLFFLAWRASSVPVYSSTYFGETTYHELPDLYPFALGAFVLWRTTSIVALASARSFVMHFPGTENELLQSLRVPRAFALGQFATRAFSFAVLYAVSAILLRSAFLLGGATMCAVAGLCAIVRRHLTSQTDRRVEAELTPSTGAPPDWYPDPTGRNELRYWDGERWTSHSATSGVGRSDPL